MKDSTFIKNNHRLDYRSVRRWKSGLFESMMVFCLLFVLLLAFWNSTLYPSDEEEIFTKGQMIARGKLLYKDIGSQHMPLMYYISALFSLLGINSIIGFRICFYVTISFVWAWMYHTYSGILGKRIAIF